MRIWPSWRRAYSSGMGSLTLRIISACRQTWSAVSIMSAPARSYRCSYSDEPSPAPFWTRTRCPAWVSSRAPSGVRATRYSLSLTSLGTPMINDRSSSQGGVSAASAYRACLWPDASAGDSGETSDLLPQLFGQEQPTHSLGILDLATMDGS